MKNYIDNEREGTLMLERMILFWIN